MFKDINSINDLLKKAESSELQKGIEVEKEHKDTIRKIYKELKHREPTEEELAAAYKDIAEDHIDEFSNYYDKLKKMESALEKEGVYKCSHYKVCAESGPQCQDNKCPLNKKKESEIKKISNEEFSIETYDKMLEDPLWENFQKENITLSYSIGLEALNYHEGQDDAVYAIGSSAIARNPVPISLVEDAIFNLEHDASTHFQEDEDLFNLIYDLKSILVDFFNNYKLEYFENKESVMKVNSSTIILTKEDPTYKDIEGILSKIAESNGIDNVRFATISVTQDEGTISFKVADEYDTESLKKDVPLPQLMELRDKYVKAIKFTPAEDNESVRRLKNTLQLIERKIQMKQQQDKDKWDEGSFAPEKVASKK